MSWLLRVVSRPSDFRKSGPLTPADQTTKPKRPSAQRRAFSAAVKNRSGRAIVDPYAGGRVLAIEDLRALLKSVAGLDAELQAAHYAAVDDRAILIRLLNNLRLRAQETQDPRRAPAAGQVGVCVATRQQQLAD